MIVDLDTMSVCLGQIKLVASPGKSVRSRRNAATDEARLSLLGMGNLIRSKKTALNSSYSASIIVQTQREQDLEGKILTYCECDDH